MEKKSIPFTQTDNKLPNVRPLSFGRAIRKDTFDTCCFNLNVNASGVFLFNMLTGMNAKICLENGPRSISDAVFPRRGKKDAGKHVCCQLPRAL